MVGRRSRRSTFHLPADVWGNMFRRRSYDDEQGFTLVEIVVSMFLLAILALAMLPVLIQGLLQSAENTTLATANQVASKYLELARAEPDTCQAVQDFAGTAVPAHTDPRGIELYVSLTHGTCPADLPGVMAFGVSVTRGDTGTTTATAETYIYVESEM